MGNLFRPCPTPQMGYSMYGSEFRLMGLLKKPYLTIFGTRV